MSSEEHPDPGPAPDGERSRSRAWRIVKIVLGVILVPLGILGLFVPVLQGVILLLVAVTLLASEIPVVARTRDELRKRHPKPFQQADRVKERLKEFFR